MRFARARFARMKHVSVLVIVDDSANNLTRTVSAAGANG